MLDLSRLDGVAPALEGLAPEVLINAAAYTAVDRAETERALAQLVNGEAPGLMARWAAAHGVPLIHFSTDYVFDGTGTVPWREDDRPHPLSVYGASKLAGEQAVRTAGGTSLIVRTSWVYAARGTNFLRRIAELAKVERELRVVADQVGAPTSAAVIAKAVAGMMSEGIEGFRVKAGKAGGIVHLAATGETSWHGFATEIVDGLRAHGLELAVERVIPINSAERPAPALRPLNSRLDLSRLKHVFGITPCDWRGALAPELAEVATSF